MSSPSQNRNVVVTGMGVVSPIGIGLDDFWDSIQAGRSGVQARDEFAETDLPLRFYAPIVGFEGKQWIKPRKAMKVMCEPIQFGCAAARMAADQAGLSEGGIEPGRVGTVFGSETFFSHPANVSDVFRRCIDDQGKYQHDNWGPAAMKEIEPLWMLKYLPNMATSHVSIAIDAQGPSNTICQREVSGLLALIEGMTLIRRGVCDAVMVGGTGSCVSLTVNLYHGRELFSVANVPPENASRPFELERNGTVCGEGAGAIVLECEQHANLRGAKIFGRIASATRNFCQTDDANFQRAMEQNYSSTLTNSGLHRKTLSHVNAHGIASKHFDGLEAKAIQTVFDDVPTLAMKSYFGFLGAGSPIIELIASILSLNNDVVPRTLNYEQADPACPCNVQTEMESTTKSAAIKTAYSVHGQIASLAIVN